MRVNRGAALAAVVMLLGGCGDQDPAQPTEGSSDTDSLTSTDPVATGPLVWEADGVVHLADHTEIDLGGLPSSYVVAGDGVFFLARSTPTRSPTCARPARARPCSRSRCSPWPTAGPTRR